MRLYALAEHLRADINGSNISKLYSNMPNSEQNVEACDAIGFDSSIEVWFIKNFSLNTVLISKCK